MDELYGQGADGGDSYEAADVGSEADRALRPVDGNGQEHWDEDAEPLTRGEYADQIRQEPAVEDQDAVIDVGKGDDEPLSMEIGQAREEVPEPRTRQEVADETRSTDFAALGREQASEIGLDRPVAEEGDLPEPRVRQEVADEARSSADPLVRHQPGETRAARAELAQGEKAEQSAAGRHQYETPGRDQHPWFMALRADASERTLGDMTPTGIGLKPTGGELLGMESRDSPESRLDRLLLKATEEADDLNDAVGNVAESVHNFNLPDPGSGHAFEGHGANDHHAPEGAAVNDLVGGAVLVGVALVAGARHWFRDRREGDRR